MTSTPTAFAQLQNTSSTISPSLAAPTTGVPQSTYPYIASSEPTSNSASAPVATSTVSENNSSKSGGPSSSIPSALKSIRNSIAISPRSHTLPSSYESYVSSKERARLLRSSRKLGQLLGATPVILGPGGEEGNSNTTDGSSTFSSSATDLHSVNSRAAEVGVMNGEGRLRGFILAMKALEGDVLHGSKKAKSKARGKENRERIKALEQLEEERSKESQREEEKRTKRMSAPPTPTSFRLPSPSSIRPSFLSKDSFTSVGSAEGKSGKDVGALDCSEDGEAEDSSSLTTTKRSGEQAQSSRSARSRSRLAHASIDNPISSLESIHKTAPTVATRKSSDSLSTMASGKRSNGLGHRRVQTDTPPLPTAPSATSGTGTAPVATSISSPTSTPTSTSPSVCVSAGASANLVRDAHSKDRTFSQSVMNSLASAGSPSTSAYASASEDSDEGPRTPSGALDASGSFVANGGGRGTGVDVMDVLEEYDVYSPSASATASREAPAENEEDMGDDELAFESDDEGDGPSFVNPWDPNRSPIEPIFGLTSDRSNIIDKDGRAARRRRLAKLTRYLGEHVPTELILTTGQRTHTHAKSEPDVGIRAQEQTGETTNLTALALASGTEQWTAPTTTEDIRPMRRVSVVASKRVLPVSLSPSTPTTSQSFFPSHPAVSPSSNSGPREELGQGLSNHPKRQRSFGKLVSLTARTHAHDEPASHVPTTSPVPEEEYEDDPSHIATTTSFASLSGEQYGNAKVTNAKDATRKRGLAMGMLTAKERQLVEDEWTPKAYEDVVSRLRKLK